MANWESTVEAPLTLDYHGVTVCKGGPWSQGPVLLQQLALLKGFDLAAMDPTGPDFVHTVTECAKLAFADREAFYGDPNFVEVPVETLLSEAYNADRRTLVGEQASLELRPGDIPGYGGRIDVEASTRRQLESGFTALGGGEPTVQTAETPAQIGGDTCHVDVIDRDGNMVGATPSGGWLHASPVIPELGFCLNSRAQMFWLDEDNPSAAWPPASGRGPRSRST